MKPCPMKVVTQFSPELTHVAKLIDDIPIAMLTTMQTGEAMASRPMAALEMDAHGALWFLTDLLSSQVEHLRMVNLCFVDTAHGSHTGLSDATPAAAVVQ